MKYLFSVQGFSIFIFAVLFSSGIKAQTINTIAGGLGDTYGAVTHGRLNGPQAVVVDGAGNLYIAENGGTGSISRVRKVSTTGIITTVAGNSLTGWNGFGGLAIHAQVGRPQGLVLDASGNLLIAYSHLISKVNSSGILTVFAGTGATGFSGDGSLAPTAQLNNPWGMAKDAAGNIYFADRSNNRVRKINTSGIISTVAGGGISGLGDGGLAIVAKLNQPRGVAVDAVGNIYIADAGNNRVRKVNTSGIISTIAGNGSGGGSYFSGAVATAVSVGSPSDVKVDPAGNVYVSNGVVLKVNTSGIITTFAGGGTGFSGDGGPAVGAGVDAQGIFIDVAGNMFIADEANDRVRKVNTSGIISTVAGNGLPYLGYGGDGGPALLAVLGRATGSGTLSVSGFYTLRGWVPGVAADRRGNVFIADANNQRVRKVDAAGIITTFVGNGIAGYAGDGGPATAAQLQQPVGMSFDGIGNMYVAEYGTHHVRKIDTFGIITTVAGGGSGGLGDGGPATAAVISAAGLCVDSIGNIFIVDIDSQRIRKVAASTGIISTVAGNGFSGFSGDGGAATLAQLSYPVGVAVDRRGNLYISDHVNARIRKVDTAGIISTIAGSGVYADYLETNLGDYGPATSATIAYPMGITTDRYGNVIFADHGIGPTNASDSFRSRYTRVREIDQYGYIHTVAGNGIQGYAGDGVGATAAEFQNPWGVAMDTAGALYIADNSNYAVRKACCLPNPTDHPPSFTGGSLQTLILCAGSATSSINTIMTISDLDAGDIETWSVSRAPTHGTLGGFPASVTATGGTIIPSGFSYTPATGYSGNDTFIIKISDGYYYTPTTVVVSINPLPVSGTISGPTSVCVGATSTLSASAGGGLWSFSNSHATIGSATGLVTGVTSGIDTARYTVTNSCGTAVTTHVITVNAVPVVAAISGPSSLCVSSSITLANTTSGGIWSSSYPYIAIGSMSGVVTGIAPGIATIDYTVTNSCGSGTSSAIVTVNPAAYAGIITGTTSVCIGGTSMLSNATTGGVWSTGATGIATIGSTAGIVTGIAAGSVVISYTISSVGCGPAVAITIVNVSSATPILPITGPSGVCAGSTISLSDATPGGIWSSSNPSIATVGSTGMVTGVLAGSTTISYTASLGCGISVASTNITVHTTPSAGVIFGTSVLCVGATGLMSSTAPGGVWSASNGHATISSTGVITGVTTGTDTIYYTVTNICGSASASRIVNIYAVPSAGTITGSASAVCMGATITLGASVSGGTWSSSNTAVAVVGTTGIVTGISIGAATISYSVTSGCGSATAVRIMTVNSVSAGTVTGITTLCVGGTSALSSTVTGGGLEQQYTCGCYSWQQFRSCDSHCRRNYGYFLFGNGQLRKCC